MTNHCLLPLLHSTHIQHDLQTFHGSVTVQTYTLHNIMILLFHTKISIM